jgi:hypothetical protein
MPTADTANPLPNMVSQVHASSPALSDREVVTTRFIGDRLFAVIGGRDGRQLSFYLDSICELRGFPREKKGM